MIGKAFFFISFFLFLLSCVDEASQAVYNSKALVLKELVLEVIDSTNSKLNFSIENSYKIEKQRIKEIRLNFKTTYLTLKDSLNKENYLDSISEVFTNLLLNKIVPHWYGTPWSFEGHTSIPNQGEIACGYFVSTTLSHMGLNVNRYHLARKGPLNEAKSLAIDTNFVLSFNSEALSIKNEFFTSFSNGLYFIGLDSHVGYLYVLNDGAYFLHSNYIEDRVMLEPIGLSEAFDSYNYCIVRITNNGLLMKSWILDTEIKVYNI